MQYHKYSQFFPLLEGEEFTALVADIQEHGLRQPILLFEDRILDGRNRYRACLKADVKPRFEQYIEDGAQGALEYVISINLRRRDLNPTQKATIALDILPEFEKLAAVRMKAGARAHQPRRAAKDAARVVGTGARTINAVKRVATHAPELMPKLRSGELTAKAAEEEIRARLARHAVKREQDKTDNKKREDPREVRKHLDAIRLFAGELREAVKIARYGKFSPEAQQFTKRWYGSIRQLMTEVEEAFNG